MNPCISLQTVVIWYGVNYNWQHLKMNNMYVEYVCSGFKTQYKHNMLAFSAYLEPKRCRMSWSQKPKCFDALQLLPKWRNSLQSNQQHNNKYLCESTKSKQLPCTSNRPELMWSPYLQSRLDFDSPPTSMFCTRKVFVFCADLLRISTNFIKKKYSSNTPALGISREWLCATLFVGY